MKAKLLVTLKLFVVLMIVISLGAFAQAKSKTRKHSHKIPRQSCPATTSLDRGCLYWTNVDMCHVSVRCLEEYSKIYPNDAPIELLGGRDKVLIDGGNQKFEPQEFKEIACVPSEPPHPAAVRAFDHVYPPANGYQYAHYTSTANKQNFRACFKFHIKRQNSTDVDPHIIVNN